MHRKAFTLIELLIVVAIIAILAAIAIPNFLEAQTRAKVSRVKGDLRALRISLESYAVDNNHYPDTESTIWHPTLQDVPAITTPIAYLSGIPAEPFVLRDARFYYDPELTDHGKNYRYYNTQRWTSIYPEIDQQGLKWYLMSNGPDLIIDINDEVSAQDTLSGKNYMYYDPTNGTISRGDIIVNNVKNAP